MIFKGRARADGGKLAAYLLSDKNEQVRVLDVRGTVIDERNAQGLKAALCDMDELGKMTRAKSSLFHLAINPDARDRMTADGWQASVEKAEKALGLEGHPRAIVSHVYEGKQHLHVVWSRVDVEQRKCVEMSFSHLKLCRAAREIELDLGLQQTPARARGAHRLSQHIKDIQQQQDKRTATPREQRREAIQSAWSQSNNGQEFKELIEAAGYRLVVGNRGVLVMDSDHEKHSIARYVEGIRLKHVHEKMSDLDLTTLPKADDFTAVKKGKTEKTETTKTTEKTETGETGETKAQQPVRRQAEQITERNVRELALKPASEEAEPGDIATRRHAANLTASQTRAAMPEQETDNTEPIQRRAQNITAEQATQELTASPDNAAEQHTPEPKYTRRRGENEMQFEARVARLKAQAERDAEKEEQLKPEMHYRPSGPVFGR